MALPFSRRALFLGLSSAACGAGADLGPPDAYRLLVPTGQTTASGLPVVKLLDGTTEPLPAFLRLLEDGFCAEMLRTAYVMKQYLREAPGFSPEAKAAARSPVCFLLQDEPAPAQVRRGLAVERWLGSPAPLAEVPWQPLRRDLPADKVAPQRVAHALATLLGQLVSTAGTLVATSTGGTLRDGYRLAMEVIAREWRGNRGPARAIPTEAGPQQEREAIAAVRENRYVVPRPGQPARTPADLLTEPGVAATVIYRLAQTKKIAQKVAPAAFYAPLAQGRIPENVSPAAVLGSFRNFQAKLLGSWATAVLNQRAPRDIIDLVEIYGNAFPDERVEVYRMFLVTTYGATVRPGISTRGEDATATLAAIQELTSATANGKLSLRAAVSP